MPTFLFTDIENSTQWWNRYPNDMGKVLGRHDALLAGQIAAHGGQVVKHTGDGVFAAFEGGQPLACAMAIQQAVCQADWNPLEGLRIRVALNSGEAERREQDYFGPAVNYAARLLTAGWGGQILLTGETLQSLRLAEGLPDGAWVEDQGVHMLKDLQEPLHIFTLLHPDLPIRQFPPLRSLSGFLNNLPAHPTPFIGREAELAEIERLCADPNCRLLTLTGPGGVGKTRLALQAASQKIDQFHHGVYLVQLASLDNPDLIPSAIGEALRINFYSQVDPRQQIQDYLREKQILLILDNFEHVLSGAVTLSGLLASAPRLKILATSRQRLNLQGEWVLEVEGMPYPQPGIEPSLETYDSILLFLTIAERVYPDFSLTREDKPYILRICQLVQGSPLGIELAASWVRSLTPREIAEEIERNLDFLETNLRDVPDRHHSLRAVFDYSWALLSKEEQRMLCKLSVFQSGFDREAARYAAGASLASLTAAVDRSLLRRTPAGRYEMLDTMRQYAEKRLLELPEDWTRTHNLHSEYYLGYLGRRQADLDGPRQVEALQEIRVEIENLRSAWDWALSQQNRLALQKASGAMFSFFEMRGRFKEGEELFARAQRALQARTWPAAEIFTSRILARLGWFAFRIGDYPRGRRSLEESLAIARQQDSSEDIAFALLYLGSLAQMLGDFSKAQTLLSESLERYQALNRPSEVASAEHTLGWVTCEIGDYDEARCLLEASLEEFKRIGNPWGTARVLNSLGNLANRLNETRDARRLREQSLAISRQLDDWRGVAVALNNLSDIAVSEGNLTESQRLLEEATSISRKIGDRRMTAIFLNNLALTYSRLPDRQAEAERTYNESLQIFTDIGDWRGGVFTAFDLASAWMNWLDYPAARRSLDQALRTAQSASSTPLALYVLSGYAVLFQQMGDRDQARALAELVRRHPESEPAAISRVESLLAELPTSPLEPAPEAAVQAELENVIKHLAPLSARLSVSPARPSQNAAQ